MVLKVFIDAQKLLSGCLVDSLNNKKITYKNLKGILPSHSLLDNSFVLFFFSKNLDGFGPEHPDSQSKVQGDNLKTDVTWCCFCVMQ